MEAGSADRPSDAMLLSERQHIGQFRSVGPWEQAEFPHQRQCGDEIQLLEQGREGFRSDSSAWALINPRNKFSRLVEMADHEN